MCNMSGIPYELKIPLSKWKRYFSQFFDKYLKIGEVKYLTHDVKFKVCPVLFYVNALCFPNFFEFWCKTVHYFPQLTQRLTNWILNVELVWSIQFFL